MRTLIRLLGHATVIALAFWVGGWWGAMAILLAPFALVVMAWLLCASPLRHAFTTVHPKKEATAKRR